MNDIQTQTSIRHTVTIPLHASEISALEKMLSKTGMKKGAYLKNLIVSDLEKNHWLYERGAK